MMKNCVILLLSVVIVVTITTTAADENESGEMMATGDLEQAESKDASATEIIKQIRKVNADGTLTVGYETDDGTFKIENRDQQGNVRMGTFGYVDEHGEVKRVAYTTENNTLLKSSEDEKDDINLASSLRYNRTYSFSTRRPSSLSYLTSTTTPPSTGSTKPTVIQNIPRRKPFTLSSEKSSRGQNNEISTGTTTVVYATSVPTPKPFNARSVTSPNFSSRSNDKVEIDQVERKVHISSPREASTTLRSVLSKVNDDNEKFETVKIGNVLRRQLKVDDEAIEAQQQVLYGGGGDEGSAIYGGGYNNVRPLFTTTSQPRIPLQVLQARQRATQLQNVLANSSPSTTSTSTTERVLLKSSKRQNLVKPKVEEVTENFNENIINQPPVERIASVASGSEANDDRRPFQRPPLPPNLENIYRSRNYLRQIQQQQELQQSQDPRLQQAQDPRLQQAQDPRLQQAQDPRLQYRLGGQEIPQQQQQLTPAAQRFAQQYQPPQSAESFQAPLFPPRTAYDLDRPLTVRDFERLLQLLVLRQSPQQSYRINPFYPPSNPLSYPPFIPGFNQGQNPYAQQIPRPPFYNPVSSGLFDPSYQNPYYSSSAPHSQQYPQGATSPVPTTDASFQQAPQNLQQQILDPNFDIQRPVVPRRRQYDQRLFAQQQQQQQQQPRDVTSLSPSEQEINYNSLQSPVSDGFLPPSVRENLLYRMLMLAIRSDQQLAPTTASASSTGPHSILEPEQQETSVIPTKSPVQSSKKPVRSVQILGEEEAEE